MGFFENEVYQNINIDDTKDFIYYAYAASCAWCSDGRAIYP